MRKKKRNSSNKEKQHHSKNKIINNNTTPFTSASAKQRSHLYYLQSMGRDAQNPIPLSFIILFISLIFTYFDVPSILKENNDKHPLPFVETLAWFLYTLTGITAEKLAPILVYLLLQFLPKENSTALSQDYLDPKLSDKTAGNYIAQVHDDFQANTYYLAINIAVCTGGYFLLTAGEKDSFCFQTGKTAMELYSTMKFINILLSLLNSTFIHFRNRSENNIQFLKQILEVIKSNTRPTWKIISHDKSVSKVASFYSTIRSVHIRKQNQCFYSLQLNDENLDIHFQHNHKSMRRRISSDLFLLVLADIFAQKISEIQIIAADNNNFIIALPFTQVIRMDQGENLFIQMRNRLANIFQKMQIAEKNAKKLNEMLNSKFTLIYENKDTENLTFSVEYKLSSAFIEHEQKFMEALVERLNQVNGITTVLEKSTDSTIFLIKNCSGIMLDRNFIEEAKKTLFSNPTESTFRNTETTYHSSSVDEHPVNTRIKIKKRPRWFLSQNSASFPSFWPHPKSQNKIQPLSKEEPHKQTIAPPQNFRGWLVRNENSHSLSLIKIPKENSKISIEEINQIATIDCTDDTVGEIHMARSYGQDGFKRYTNDTFWLKDRNNGIRMLLEKRKDKVVQINGKPQTVPCYRAIKLGHK